MPAEGYGDVSARVCHCLGQKALRILFIIKYKNEIFVILSFIMNKTMECLYPIADGIQRSVFHPFLILVWHHGKTQAF